MNTKKMIFTVYCMLSVLLSLDCNSAQDMTQVGPKTKREQRAQEFGYYLLAWCDRSAYYDIKRYQIRRAETRDISRVASAIPELVQDSTYYANQIMMGADIINDIYDINKPCDMVYAAYSMIDAYKEEYPGKDAPEYILGQNMHEYERVLKKLKLARYTVQVNQK